MRYVLFEAGGQGFRDYRLSIAPVTMPEPELSVARKRRLASDMHGCARLSEAGLTLALGWSHGAHGDGFAVRVIASDPATAWVNPPS